jgi:hypothetical protein
MQACPICSSYFPVVDGITLPQSPSIPGQLNLANGNDRKYANLHVTLEMKFYFLHIRADLTMRMS